MAQRKTKQRFKKNRPGETGTETDNRISKAEARHALSLALKGLADLHAQADPVLREMSENWLNELVGDAWNDDQRRNALYATAELLFGESMAQIDMGIANIARARNSGLPLTVHDHGGYKFEIQLANSSRVPMAMRSIFGISEEILTLRPARPVVTSAEESLFYNAANLVHQESGDIDDASARAVGASKSPDPAVLTVLPPEIAALAAIGAGGPAVRLGGLDVPRGRRGHKVKSQMTDLKKAAGLKGKQSVPAVAQAANLADRLVADAIAVYTVSGTIQPAIGPGEMSRLAPEVDAAPANDNLVEMIELIVGEATEAARASRDDLRVTVIEEERRLKTNGDRSTEEEDTPDTITGGAAGDTLNTPDPNMIYGLEDLDMIKAKYRAMVSHGRTLGLNFAADLLEHFLDGSGTTITMTRDEVRALEPMAQLEENIKDHIASAIRNEIDKKTSPWISEILNLADGGIVESVFDKWESIIDLISSYIMTIMGDRDFALGIGRTYLTGYATLNAMRTGDKVLFFGEVDFEWDERYDFNRNDPYSAELNALVKSKKASNFRILAKWRMGYSGSQTLKPSGNFENQIIEWLNL